MTTKRPWATWSESCLLIGYLGGQDGPTFPTRDFPFLSLARKSLRATDLQSYCLDNVGNGVAKSSRSQSKQKKQTTLMGSFCYRHSWLSFPYFEKDKPFLILDKAKSFRYKIKPLLTKLVRSRRLDIGLVLFLLLFSYGPRPNLGLLKCKKKNIQPSWPQAWSITHMHWDA